MTSDPPHDLPLEPEEFVVRGWAVDAIELDGEEGPRGWLVLTTRRCIFARRGGLFGSHATVDPSRTVRLEAIRYAGLRRFSIGIGIGERGAVLGVELAGRGYRSGRRPPPSAILAAIARERLTRREALGLAGDAPECGACGSCSFPWSTVCLQCGRTLGAAASGPARPV